MSERFPVLRRALVNQYQAILVGGAAALSIVTASPLPALLLLGGELIALPLLHERLRKRLDAEKHAEDRQVKALTQEQLFAQLPAASRSRLARLQQLCADIQKNYAGLAATGQAVVASQASKFDAIVVAFLQRLWLLQKLDELVSTADEEGLRGEVGELEKALADKELAERVREAREQNLSIKRKLLEAVTRNESNRAALATELDTIESLLQLLAQKSVAVTDAETLSGELDDVLAHVEADVTAVSEVQQLMGALSGGAVLSENLKNLSPPPPLPTGARQRPSERTRR